MKDGRVSPACRIYPAYCNAVSPTFNKWVKLTAADVHGLQQVPGSEGQNVFFHLNHPIRYVYLVGSVLDIDFLGNWLAILVLDDGSGQTIDVKIRRNKPSRDLGSVKERLSRLGTPSADNKQDSTRAQDREESSDDDHQNEQQDDWHIATPRRTSKGLMSSCGPKAITLRPHPDTSVSNVTIVDTCLDPYCEDRLHVAVDKEVLEVGSIVKAKGLLSVYRNNFQMELERISVVRAADEESRIWNEYATFVSDVLARPWSLSDEDVKGLEQASHAAARTERKAQQDREARDRQRIQKLNAIAEHEERAERKRQAMAPVLDGNPLDRPNWRPWSECQQAHSPAVPARINRARRPKSEGQDLRREIVRKRHAVRIGPG